MSGFAEAIYLGCLALAGALSQPKAEIVFAGDAMQHFPQYTAARQSDGTVDFTQCFEALAPVISEADYAVVNLETPVGTPPYSGYPCFSAPVCYATALRDAGFDMLLTANNHTLDRRDAGLRRTVEVLDSLGVDHLGTYPTGASRSQRTPVVKDINGFKVGFINYTYDTNGIPVQGDVAVDLIDPELIDYDIRRVREAGAEIICAAMHWGIEYQMVPVRDERVTARYLLDRGVDIIIGGHPHVVQPMRLGVNPVTSRNAALVYSLGNFISNQHPADSRGGCMVKVTLRRDSKGRAYVAALANRLVFVVKGHPGCNYRVVPADAELPAGVAAERDTFVRNVQKIFALYNRNITPW